MNVTGSATLLLSWGAIAFLYYLFIFYIYLLSVFVYVCVCMHVLRCATTA